MYDRVTSFQPPFCVIKLTTCCWWVSRTAFINLSHCSSVSSRSKTASLRSYAALSPARTLLYCLRVSTPRRRRWSSSPKSGSTMPESWDFRFTMVVKLPAQHWTLVLPSHHRTLIDNTIPVQEPIYSPNINTMVQYIWFVMVFLFCFYCQVLSVTTGVYLSLICFFLFFLI